MTRHLLIPIFFLVAVTAQAQLLKNGSFEQFTGNTCVFPGAGCNPCYACSTGAVMPNWHVDAGNVDIMSTTAPTNSNLKAGVPNGIYGIDLNGTRPGTISQEVSNLQPNYPYSLSFYYSNNDINTAQCGMDKPMQVTVYDENGDVIVSYKYRTDTMPSPKLSARFNRWTKALFTFTPMSNFAKIEFKSLFGASGPVLGCGFDPTNPSDQNIIYGPTLDSVTLSGLIVLPIHLLSFDGTYGSDGLKLKWKTADEESLQKMVVQYDNGLIWEDIGTLPAKGNRGSNDYAISIPAATVRNSPEVALRLKLQSADNKTSYSQVIYLKSKAKKSITVFPNPATKNFINIYGLEAGQNITIYNATGQVLLTKKATGASEQIDLRNSAAGIYHVTVVDRFGNLENLKFVKSN